MNNVYAFRKVSINNFVYIQNTRFMQNVWNFKNSLLIVTQIDKVGKRFANKVNEIKADSSYNK
jgi:hypothetical protein